MVASSCKITASSNASEARNIVSTAMSSFWSPDSEDKKPELRLCFDEEQVFDKIVLSENIANGQFIEGFEVLFLNEKGKWKSVFEGGSVGYKRICCIKPTKAKEIKIQFTQFRALPQISHIQIN